MKNVKKKVKSIVEILVVVLLVFCSIFKTEVINNIEKTVASFRGSNQSIEKNKSNTKKDAKDNLFVYFIDVGQADCILIKTKNYNMLIDAGNNEDGPLLVDYFKSLGIKKFKYVVGTHPHEDHIGGMDDIINNFDIETYYMPDKISTTKTFEDVLDALDNKKLKYNLLNNDDEFNLDDANFKVISNGLLTSDINDSSIILKLTYGNNSFLFTGDATSKVEKNILNKDIKSDVLKVAHHGSNYSSSTEFLNKVLPSYAVISVGLNNIYNHPASSTIEKLNNMNVNIYKTSSDGTIIFTSDGKNIDVSVNKTNTNGD